MIREEVDELLETIAVQRLDGRRDRAMAAAALDLELVLVGDLLNEDLPEAVRDLGRGRSEVDEILALERRKVRT